MKEKKKFNKILKANPSWFQSSWSKWKSLSKSTKL